MRYFVKVCELGSFTAAAAELFVAQQAVSQQVKAAEQMLGVTLLDRGPPVIPTAAGAVFLQEARRLVEAADQLVDRTRAAARGEVGRLRCGYTKTAAFETYPQMQAAVHESLPQVELTGREIFAGDAPGLLLRGEIDLVAAPHVTLADAFETRPLRHEPLMAALAHDHQLAGAESLDLVELRHELFELWPREMSPGYHDAVMDACRAAGFTPQVDSSTAGSPVWNAIATGRGVALLVPSEQLRAPAGIVVVPLHSPPGRVVTVDLFWLRDNPNPVMPAVLEVAARLAERNGWLT
jgi:DNA-binding transcriptional LysR family regulator